MGGGDFVVDLGAGNDTLNLLNSGSWGGSGQATITTGTGADTLMLSYGAATYGAADYGWTPSVVNDFTVGSGGDVIDLTDVLANLGLSVDADPFASGHLRLLQSGTSTHLMLDTSGSANLQQSVTALILNNVSAINVTAGNFTQVVTPLVALNHAPTASNRAVSFNEDTSKTFALADFGFSDVDAGDSLQSVTVTTLEALGALKLNGVDVTLNQVISAADITAGKLSYTPVANGNGAGYASFGFKVSDGLLSSDSAYTMTLNVTPVNDAPTASNRAVTFNEDTTKTFALADFGFSDVDAGDSLQSVTVTTLEALGALKLNGVDVTLNQVISAADITAGKLTYSPVANGNGAGYASFGFKVSDGLLSSASAYTMTLNVTPVNDAPTGSVTISGTATQNQTLTASNTLADVDGLGTISYQWLADGAAITGATASTFTLTQAQVGKAVSVKASYTDSQGTAEGKTSSATAAVVNVNDAATGAVTITNNTDATRGTTTLRQGDVLAAANTLADADGLGTITYTWKAGSDTVGTGATYTLTQADVGKAITVTARYIDLQSTDESVVSSATAMPGPTDFGSSRLASMATCTSNSEASMWRPNPVVFRSYSAARIAVVA